MCQQLCIRRRHVATLECGVGVAAFVSMIPPRFYPLVSPASNVTDIIAKLLMLSKRTDPMDVLSQKAFWKMYSDPYVILTVQELALEL